MGRSSYKIKTFEIKTINFDNKYKRFPYVRYIDDFKSNSPIWPKKTTDIFESSEFTFPNLTAISDVVMLSESEIICSLLLFLQVS